MAAPATLFRRPVAQGNNHNSQQPCKHFFNRQLTPENSSFAPHLPRKAPPAWAANVEVPKAAAQHSFVSAKIPPYKGETSISMPPAKMPEPVFLHAMAQKETAASAQVLVPSKQPQQDLTPGQEQVGVGIIAAFSIAGLSLAATIAVLNIADNMGAKIKAWRDARSSMPKPPKPKVHYRHYIDY